MAHGFCAFVSMTTTTLRLLVLDGAMIVTFVSPSTRSNVTTPAAGAVFVLGTAIALTLWTL
jgi:hypothetical protein